MSSTKAIINLCILLFLCDRITCLVIPEELPTILSLVYSNIPPIKKGTDSRIGVGFRLGEHADYQVLLELGPQTETDPIGNADAKKRRNAMLTAAMNGELGPLARAIAKYQMERKLQRELEKLKKMDSSKLKSPTNETSSDKKTEASEWLTKWSNDMVKSSEDQASLRVVSSEKNISSSLRIGRPPESNGENSHLTKLYQPQTEKERQ